MFLVPNIVRKLLYLNVLSSALLYAGPGSEFFQFIECEQSLIAEEDSSKLVEEAWIPETDQLGKLADLITKNSNSPVFNSELFIDLVKQSPLFKKALAMSLFELGVVHLDLDQASPELVASWVIGAIFNNGLEPRVFFHDALTEFITETAMANGIVDSLNLASGPLGKWIERSLHDDWFGETTGNPVYGWVNQSKKLQAVTPSSSLIIAPVFADMNTLNTVLRLHSEEPLITFGVAIPDQVFFFFQKKQEEFDQLMDLKKKLWSIGKAQGIFDPFDHEEVAAISLLPKSLEERQIRERAVRDKLLASAAFFATFSDFADLFESFVGDLSIEVESGSFGSEQEYSYLNKFVNEKLQMLPIELEQIGISFHTDSPRYKACVRKISNALSEINRLLK